MDFRSGCNAAARSPSWEACSHVAGLNIPDELRLRILQVARRHGVTDIRVFGSVAAGTATDQSDFDFLIRADGPTTPWFPGGLVADLEELLGRRVDVVEVDALRDSFRERVLREAVPL
jgi:predicted nucleotidyltransferase